MGGYSLKGKKYLVEAGDKINDAVNLWIDASIHASEATLESGALSKHGHQAEALYSESRQEAVQKLQASQNSLIETREAMYQVAGVYSRAEQASIQRIARNSAPRHRPEIDDPRYG
ncbi:hypothetical protein [Actinomadura litoris]|uniref:hypothetical protein n=1 Tax=Actinomadura litoris TaxID=2678616 RepID=UPI001FA80E5A|nr:hypothetical protein [Actinomadura litoris]